MGKGNLIITPGDTNEVIKERLSLPFGQAPLAIMGPIEFLHCQPCSHFLLLGTM